MDAGYTRTDLDALELAIAQTLSDPDRVEQVQSMLQDEDRVSVGKFCSYHHQMRSLHLRPWEFPPCWIDDPDEVLASTRANGHGERAAATLLLQMLALGISQFHPDPLAAIDASSMPPTNRE